MIPLSHLAPSNTFRICPTDAVRAMRIRFQRFSLRTHRFSSRRTEEAVAGDRLRPRRGCEDACNPLIFRKTLKEGAARRLFVERDRACFPRGHFLSASKKPRMSTLRSAFKTGSLPSIPDFSRDATATSEAVQSAHFYSSTMRGIACGAQMAS